MFLELSDVLVQYVPYLVAIITFIMSCVGFVYKLSVIFKNNNIDKIKEELKDSNSEIHNECINLKDQLQALIDDNANLKKLNIELLRELKRISDYDPLENDSCEE